MNAVPSLLDLLHASFDATPAPNEAYTVTKRVEIAPGISDVQYLDVTPGAAEIYGRSTADLIGNWVSLTHPMEAHQHARRMGAARHYHHEDIPTVYIGTILRPNGSTIPVIKDTRQLLIRGDLHWLTRIRPASDNPNLPEQESIRVPHFEDTQRLAVNYSIAEIQALIAGANKESLPSGIYSSIMGQINSIGGVEFLSNAVRRTQCAENDVQLLMGRPLQRMSSGQLLAECQRCAHVWSPQKQSDILVYDQANVLIDIHISERCGGPSHCRNWMSDFTIEELAPLLAPQVTT